MIDGLDALLSRFLPTQDRGGQVVVSIPDGHPKSGALAKAFAFLQKEGGNDQRAVGLFVSMLRDVVEDRSGFEAELRRIGFDTPAPTFAADLCRAEILGSVSPKRREWLLNATEDGFRKAKIASTEDQKERGDP